MPQTPLTIGGQAVIEGVMMRGPDGYAISVRRADGTIEREVTPYIPWSKKWPVLKLPILRGAVSLIEMMIIGMKSLEFSANKAALDDPEEAKKKLEAASLAAVKDAPGIPEEPAISKGAMALTFAISIAIAIAMGVVIPNLAAHFAGRLAGGGKALLEEQYPITYNLISGVIRMLIIVGYIWAISLMNDVKRLFRYHGAEHKAVACFESGRELTVENVRPCPKLHPRCGTTFIALVLIVAVIVFAFFARALLTVWPEFATLSFPVRKTLLILGHILLMPIVAGVCFEILRLGGKYRKNPLLALLILPGFLFQRLTVKEPDDSMIEIAIDSLKSALGISAVPAETREEEETEPEAAAV